MIPELMSSSDGLWAWDLPEEPSYVGPALCPTSQLPHPLKPSQTNRSLPKPAGKSGSARPALDRPPGLQVQAWPSGPLTRGDALCPSSPLPVMLLVSEEPDLLQGAQQLSSVLWGLSHQPMLTRDQH